MQYYVETQVTDIVGKRLVVWNWKKNKWQPKLTNSCLTNNKEQAEVLVSTRKLINNNTRLLIII